MSNDSEAMVAFIRSEVPACADYDLWIPGRLDDHSPGDGRVPPPLVMHPAPGPDLLAEDRTASFPLPSAGCIGGALVVDSTGVARELVWAPSADPLNGSFLSESDYASLSGFADRRCEVHDPLFDLDGGFLSPLLNVFGPDPDAPERLMMVNYRRFWAAPDGSFTVLACNRLEPAGWFVLDSRFDVVDSLAVTYTAAYKAARDAFRARRTLLGDPVFDELELMSRRTPVGDVLCVDATELGVFVRETD